ncbi:HK97 family phage prohead protease [Defluviimonas sp. D31]|uniref:HK97 family phage prohead protease n=1 Tax=Defluviimonas sp. D31 TaxID=3083253 RepID=UPI00296FA163|nr:HK97 family phage prohead protease [Defluviimonas sp. D31]MDW4550876.1 HK97 family phage prohead protease [Defluviimonas sp. D31]
MTDREIRLFAQPLELRAAAPDAPVTVVGYAAVFNQATAIGDMFEEVIAPGAFTEALRRGDDAAFLINHEGLPLARTSSGTLKLAEDSRGLRIETDLDPADPDVARILPKMRRGDLTKMSFAFRATRQEWEDRDPLPRRTILEVELFDVSIVTDPAYAGTEIGLRAMAAALGRASRSAATIAARMARKARLARLAG